MIKIGVFGNRDITDEDQVLEKFQLTVGTDEELLIVHGGAAGPARMISDRAKVVEGAAEVCFKPWSMIFDGIKFHPKLFYFRNKQVVDNSDTVLIFTNGNSDSEVTRVIDLCERWEKNYQIINIEDES